MRKAMLVVTIVILGSAAQAQEELLARGRDSESAGRLKEAFELYRQAMSKLTENDPLETELRERIVRLAPRLDPPPEVPEDAERFATRGQLAFAEAKGRGDLEISAAEFRKAVRAAPWWPVPAFNLALVEARLENYDAAIASMKLYLASDPPDAAEAKKKLFEFEFRNERRPGTVVVYRKRGMFGRSAKLTLVADGTEVALIPMAGYVRLRLDTGPHTLLWKHEKHASKPLRLNVTPGSTTYVALHWDANTPKLVLESQAVGEIREMTHVSEDGILDFQRVKR